MYEPKLSCICEFCLACKLLRSHALCELFKEVDIILKLVRLYLCCFIMGNTKLSHTKVIIKCLRNVKLPQNCYFLWLCSKWQLEHKLSNYLKRRSRHENLLEYNGPHGPWPVSASLVVKSFTLMVSSPQPLCGGPFKSRPYAVVTQLILLEIIRSLLE